MSFKVSMERLVIKSSFVILFFLGFVSASFAGNTAIDSVGVEKIGDRTFIIHEVKSKETLFSISRRYETPVGEIIENNSELKQGLKIGQRIKVPFIPKAALPEGAVLHKVAPGETLFAIATKYEVSVEDVKKWNELKGNDLSVGQGLVIEGVKPVQEAVAREAPEVKAVPTKVNDLPKERQKMMEEGKKAKEKKEEKKKVEEPKEKANKQVVVENAPGTTERIENIPAGAEVGWITHTVKDGETLYAISKRYNANMGDLINWNALSSNNLKEGQKLKVGRKEGAVNNATPVTEVSQVEDEATTVTATSTYKVGKASEESTEYKNIKESGQAEVIQGTGNHKKYLVLHRKAPVGTIMRIRNEENDVMIFARVVGKLPDTGDNSKLLIKVSQAAFDQLRAVNNRFRVEVSY
ncbi:LysM peptidoglycan-binding domain-containing protein [Echinicola shivajiensis]|uniref:LysM peptidoglycan-binding domain-containing protein n=1 Tax=Echinicola shivajiensis TaxID=1035916 RepID=UPI001BFC8DFB|nr:LysM peptidoglycan-binding domain-containing protein [Echinicola shivajiensis]